MIMGAIPTAARTIFNLQNYATMYKFSFEFWLGPAYGYVEFEEYGNYLYGALEKLAARLINNNEWQGSVWCRCNAIDRHHFTADELKEMGYRYVEATKAGAPFDCYMDLRGVIFGEFA